MGLSLAIFSLRRRVFEQDAPDLFDGLRVSLHGVPRRLHH